MESIIIKYLQGEVSKEEKEALLTWLKQNDNNSKEFQNICQTWIASGGTLSNEQEISLAFDKLKNSICKVENKEEDRTPAKKRISLSKIAIVAAACIAAIIITWKFAYNPSNTNTHKVWNEIVAESKSKEMHTLPDGSTVWIKSGSKISYNYFDENSRLVQLQGEAFFKVVRNENKPFIVESGNVKIEVLGTEFDIKNYNNHDYIETTLLSGSIALLVNDSKQIKLEPNQKAIYNKTSNSIDIKTVDATNETLWTKDQLTFSDEKLSVIFEKIGYWFDKEIKYDGKINLDKELSLAIRDESEEELLQAISLISDIKYEIRENEIIISSR